MLYLMGGKKQLNNVKKTQLHTSIALLLQSQSNPYVVTGRAPVVVEWKNA